MSGFEFNKIFGAILFAALVAMLSGFIADKVVSTGEHGEGAAIEIATTPAETPAAAPVAVAEPIDDLLAAADIAAGQKVARACQACHSFDKGGPAKVGPNLWNIVNAKHAHIDGFAYSDVMKSMHEKLWTYDDLNAYLFSPKAYAPGNKMAFAGIKNTKDRANLIAWLRTLADSPAPLPK